MLVPPLVSSSLLKNSLFARQGPLVIGRLIMPGHRQDAQKGCPARPQRVKDRRRYPPHFVGPFARTMESGERINPSSTSASRISIGTLRI